MSVNKPTARGLGSQDLQPVKALKWGTILWIAFRIIWELWGVYNDN